MTEHDGLLNKSASWQRFERTLYYDNTVRLLRLRLGWQPVERNLSPYVYAADSRVGSQRVLNVDSGVLTTGIAM